MTNFHVVNGILHEITWNKSKKTVQKFIYINKIIHDHISMIFVLDHMVITWSSAHTMTNYQFISMNTNNSNNNNNVVT
jgi:hypothetical protein